MQNLFTSMRTIGYNCGICGTQYITENASRPLIVSRTSQLGKEGTTFSLTLTTPVDTHQLANTTLNVWFDGRTYHLMTLTSLL